MPSYPGASGAFISAASNLSPISLQKAETQYVWGTLSATATQLPITDGTVVGETPLAGTPSIAVCLQSMDAMPPPSVMVEGRFSGAPGGFEIDIQEADTDADGWYILPSNAAYKVTAVDATKQTFRADLSPTGGRFMRVLLVSRTNAVSLVCKITRMG